MSHQRRTSFDDMTRIFETPFIAEPQANFSVNIADRQQNSPLLSLSLDNILNDDYLSFLTSNPTPIPTVNMTDNQTKSAFYSYNTQNLSPFIPQQMSISPSGPTVCPYNLPTPINTTIKSFFFDTDREGLTNTKYFTLSLFCFPFKPFETVENRQL
jgi:hypothetical protein